MAELAVKAASDDGALPAERRLARIGRNIEGTRARGKPLAYFVVQNFDEALDSGVDESTRRIHRVDVSRMRVVFGQNAHETPAAQILDRRESGEQPDAGAFSQGNGQLIVEGERRSAAQQLAVAIGNYRVGELVN